MKSNENNTDTRKQALRGNQNAAKPEGQRVSGLGRVTVDLGDLYDRINLERSQIEQATGRKPSIKSIIVEALEARYGEK